MRSHVRLSDGELKIMETVWAAGAPMTSTELALAVGSSSLPALMTQLSRLCQKGVLCCDRSTRQNLYSAVLSAEEVRAAEGHSLLQRLCGSKVSSLVSALYDGQVIGKEDLAELRALIDRLEGVEK